MLLLAKSPKLSTRWLKVSNSSSNESNFGEERSTNEGTQDDISYDSGSRVQLQQSIIIDRRRQLTSIATPTPERINTSISSIPDIRTRKKEDHKYLRTRRYTGRSAGNIIENKFLDSYTSAIQAEQSKEAPW